jgi:inosine-uridine nucleoside N-ribohydrolase
LLQFIGYCQHFVVKRKNDTMLVRGVHAGQYSIAFIRRLLLPVLSSLLLFDCEAAELSARKPVKAPLAAVLSTDCGVEIDDQWALTHLLLSPEIDLQAVVTSHAASIGFSSTDSAAKAAEVIAHVLPLKSALRLPVIAGAASPLKSAAMPTGNAAVDCLIRISKGHSAENPLTIFLTGAGTDVASAILKDPSIVRRVSVIAMGFDDWPGGGDVFNVKNDPFAWQVILDSDVPVAVGSSALTSRSLRLTHKEAAALIRPHGPIGAYLYSILDDFMTKQPEMVARYVAPDTWVVWDEAVVAYALGMARVKDVPRPKLQPDLSFRHPQTGRRIKWLSEIDTARFWRDLTQKMDRWK